MSPAASLPDKPQAYSYLRFSTPEQMKGDSFRRQTKMAEDYAARKGLILNDTFTFHDLGVSGFRGDNVASGMLGYFKEAVQSGEVPAGSYLLVESLDRISRQNARRAQRVLEDIADLGITVVTLIDGREYSKESMERDPIELIMSILQFMRANEESATKARRLKEAWAAKRDRLDKQPLTSRVPAWITLNRDTNVLELIPERAAVIERIFADTLKGLGSNAIAAALNEEGVKPWGRASYWQRSYLAKVLASEAVIGNFTPQTLEYIEGKRTRVPQGKVEGYFPAAISKELWAEVHALSQGKQAKARGRQASAPVSSMLARLATCPLCGGTMTRVTKGARSSPKFVCIRAKRKAGCRYKIVSVAEVEEALILRLPERLRDAPAGDRNPVMDQQISNVEGEIEGLQTGLHTLLAAIQKGGEAVSILQRVRAIEGEIGERLGQLRKLEAERASVSGQTVQARISRLMTAIRPEEGEPQPAAVNLALRAVFKRVTIDYRYGELVFEWLHGGEVELPYALPEGTKAVSSKPLHVLIKALRNRS